ncbi:Fpg/Nei family DNA glycosylase [Limnochorda pilosa]|uniref:Formamidopyrimidine-DNA glycosylase n=1 Tax=Limnochorda pilosa TaxID=1555112 RepID=A0A0K2SR61_LIMPI|nr:DNA-formamidopyrimidine glycosylase family protein [Limnochorda pilosa]BAS29309.1 formamidopyrimidine-DNA glycosylase [Limnochorda pilosa]
MPELPELEAVRLFLREVLPGREIVEAQVFRPTVIRCLAGEPFPEAIRGRRFESVGRRGKFLRFGLSDGLEMVINPMLTGRLQWARRGDRRLQKGFFSLLLDGGHELRYSDAKSMGMVYLLPAADLEQIPRFADQGPEADDPNLDLEAFRARLRRFHGEVKSILTNHRFLAGIGNAYADEILFEAGIYPFRRRPSLTVTEVEALHRALVVVLGRGLARAREAITETGEIHLKPRGFFAVHGRPGEPCLRCGRPVSAVRTGRIATHFCRTCQPGSLVRN